MPQHPEQRRARPQFQAVAGPCQLCPLSLEGLWPPSLGDSQLGCRSSAHRLDHRVCLWAGKRVHLRCQIAHVEMLPPTHRSPLIAAPDPNHQRANIAAKQPSVLGAAPSTGLACHSLLSASKSEAAFAIPEALCRKRHDPQTTRIIDDSRIRGRGTPKKQATKHSNRQSCRMC